MSEYLLTGITISIAASLVVGGCAGAVKGMYGIHSGHTLRTLALCENVWVIFVLGAEVVQVWLAYENASTKDVILVCLVFVLTIPSLSWIYSRSEAAAANMFERGFPSAE